MLNIAFSTGIMSSSVTVIYHTELYRLVLLILRLKCLKLWIAVATKYALTAHCYRLI
ncbi:MAG: hypothetical protein ACTS73_09285 [Arsenophonus sp. NEOnobi-MAG3]